MKRGEICTVVTSGDYGKPRPAVIIQSELFEALECFTVLPITSTLVEAPLLRFTVEPTPENGLLTRSQIMIDKILTVRRQRLGKVVGELDATALTEIERRLALFLGLAR